MFPWNCTDGPGRPTISVVHGFATVGDLAFPIAAARTWNVLRRYVRTISASFCRRLLIYPFWCSCGFCSARKAWARWAIYREGKSRDPLLGGFWRHFCLYIAYRHKTIGQILVIIVISYYRFPSDRNMLKNCLKAIRRDNCSFVYYSAILTMFTALPVPYVSVSWLGSRDVTKFLPRDAL